MKNFGERLNGWQRLWIVCGIIYFTVVAGVTVPSIPSKLTINEYLSDVVEDGDAVPIDIHWYVRLEKKWMRVDRIATNEKTGEHIYLLNGKLSEPIPALEYVKIPHELSREESRVLRKKQAVFISKAFMWWLLPWLLLYFCGLAISWIIIGYRTNKPA